MRRGALLLVGFAAACSAPEVFVQRVWPDGSTAVLVVLDARGVPVGAPRIVSSADGVARLEVDASEPRRLVVQTFDGSLLAPNGLSLSECGVVFGGEGSLLPAPIDSWSSAVLEPGAVDLALEREAVPTRIELRFAPCPPFRDPCVGYSATEIAVPARFDPRRVAAVDDNEALIGGVDRREQGTQLVRIRGLVAEPLPGDLRIRGRTERLAWDHQGTFFLVTSEPDAMLRLGPDGTLLEVPAVEGVEMVSAGADGTVLAYGPAGGLQLAAGSTRAVPRADLPPDEIRDVLVVSADVLLLRAKESIWVFEGAWHEAYRFAFWESVSDVVADEGMMGLVGEVELVRVRDAEQRWESYARPFDGGNRLRTAGGLKNGRFIVAGDFGRVAIWDGRRWCPVLLPGVTTTISDLDVSESGRVAWVAGKDDASGPPVIYKIEVPAP